MLEQLAKELLNNRWVDVLTYNAPTPLSNEAINTLELENNIRLSLDVKRFYQLSNGFRLSWRLKPELPTNIRKAILAQLPPKTSLKSIKGCINIINLEKALNPSFINSVLSPNTLDLPFEFEDKTSTYGKFAEYLRPFDRFDEDIDFYCAAFIFDILSQKAKVILLSDYYADWHDSKIIFFEDYLEMVVYQKGITMLRLNTLTCYRGDKLPPINNEIDTIKKFKFTLPE